MRKLNIKLLKKMRKRIAEKPYSYYQDYWAVKDDKAPCGTKACLAGEAIICSERSVKKGLEKLWASLSPSRSERPSVLAQELLGLSGIEADTMFMVGGAAWPEPFRSRFERASGPIARAKVAVAYLDHIIKTGEVIE